MSHTQDSKSNNTTIPSDILFNIEKEDHRGAVAHRLTLNATVVSLIRELTIFISSLW